jgi:hypothetical protein
VAGLALYDPFRGEVKQDPAGFGSAPVRELRPEPSGAASAASIGAPGGRMYVRTLDGWYRVDSFTLRAEPVGAGRVPGAAPAVDPGRVPFLSGNALRGERSGRPERFELTGAARLPDNWLVLGTWGGGVWLYDPVRLSPEPAAFGLAGPGDGPMAWDGSRLWFTNAVGPARSAVSVPGRTTGPEDRTGIASASGELRDWTYAYPGLEPALPSDRVYDVASSRGLTLFATDAGLALHDAKAGWRRLPPLAGGAAEVLAVEPAADGFWLGTRDGLAALRAPGAGRTGSEADSSSADSLRVSGRWLEGRSVRGLASDASEIYAATDAGLYRLAPRGSGSQEWTLSPVETLGKEALDVALVPDAVVAATDRGVEILPRGEGEPQRFLLGEGRLKERPLAVAADAASVWIATSSGVSRWDRTRRLWTDYGLADGLPDLPVRHVLIQDARHVWFSTPGGATRLDLGSPPRAR